MVTIAIISIMLVLVAPSFSDFLRKQRLLSAADSVASAIGQARTRALAQSAYVTIAPRSMGTGRTAGGCSRKGKTRTGSTTPRPTRCSTSTTRSPTG
ncbi:pilus assembly FimT family protein [Ralstonia pseudosolanacearum]|uniref:pilus assembly FimT family protein n=1 Tax=Ralstonia pseudosolanacearum TaxID=1310165 RepID=UPI0022346F0D|nr:hypothetical protein [Ralstonia sp. RS642]